ncbi:MAG: hypothetical protein JNM94_15520 [Phycisphaerae bacterium]|nr:hypothetical protein [Phycisphaerae bacterium]
MCVSAEESEGRGPERPVAILLHRLSDGSEHVDLFIGPVDGRNVKDDERAVLSWRCATRPDALPIGGVTAIERIADHRGRYLRLTTPTDLSDNRGHVTPLRRGVGRGAATIAIAWADGGHSRWRFDESAGRATLTALSTAEPRSADSEENPATRRS